MRAEVLSVDLQHGHVSSTVHLQETHAEERCDPVTPGPHSDAESPTSSPVITGKGVTGVGTQARPWLKVNSTASTPMMVQQEPSFSTTLPGSLGLQEAWRTPRG